MPQAGLVLLPPVVTCCACRQAIPHASGQLTGMEYMSWPPAPRVDTNAIWLPSGDQAGRDTFALLKLSAYTLQTPLQLATPPETSTATIWLFPPSPPLTKAMDFPSGDHAGFSSSVLGTVEPTRRKSPPSVRMD